MPSAARRRLLVSVGVLLGLAGCSGENQSPTEETTDQSRTTRRTQTTHPPQTDRPGWVGLEVENNHEETHEVTVSVTADHERTTTDTGGTTTGTEGATADAGKLFERTLTLRSQSEPEFNSVVRIPASGDRRVRVTAEFAEGPDDTDDGNSPRFASASFTVSADAEYQRLFVTIDREGLLQLTQGTEPSEPIRTTSSE